MEPDVLQGAKAPGPADTVILFSLGSETTEQPSDAYEAATLALQAAALVAYVDAGTQHLVWEHLHKAIASWEHLTPAHRQRLGAKIQHFAVQPVTLAALKKKLEALPPDTRTALAGLLTATALSTGSLSVARVKALEKIYKAMQLEPDKVFGDLHVTATRGAPASHHEPEKPFSLDMQRVAALQVETQAVSALLSNIFSEEGPAPTEAPPRHEGPSVSPGAAEPSGPLQALHSVPLTVRQFGEMLLADTAWPRETAQAKAKALGLMLDGVLEQLNDAAFDAFDMAFTEGDDPVTVNPEILELLKS
jgi:hypothetical protein